MFWNIVAVTLGGGLGALLRYLVYLLMSSRGTLYHPQKATLIVNVVGCLLLGLITGYFLYSTKVNSDTLKLFLTVGICGGFTTYSTFSMDFFRLISSRNTLIFACLYLLGTLILGILSIGLGLWIGKMVCK